MLTKRTAAIVTAYTGRVLGSFMDARDYMEELMHKDSSVNPFGGGDSVKRASKNDFMNIPVGSGDKALTVEEAAIIAAYTGIGIGEFQALHEYIEKILGHPVMTHELGNKEIWEDIREACYDDFVALSNSVVKD